MFVIWLNQTKISGKKKKHWLAYVNALAFDTYIFFGTNDCSRHNTFFTFKRYRPDSQESFASTENNAYFTKTNRSTLCRPYTIPITNFRIVLIQTRYCFRELHLRTFNLEDPSIKRCQVKQEKPFGWFVVSNNNRIDRTTLTKANQ